MTLKRSTENYSVPDVSLGPKGQEWEEPLEAGKDKEAGSLLQRLSYERIERC